MKLTQEIIIVFNKNPISNKFEIGFFNLGKIYQERY